MTLLLLTLLAGAWAWWGFVTWRGRRASSGGVSSISSFNNHLSVLERTSPDRLGFSTVGARPAHQLRDPRRPSGSAGIVAGLAKSPGFGRGTALGAPARERATLTLSEARRRRRTVLTGLVGGLVGSLLLAAVFGGPFVFLAGLVTVVLASYGGLLAWTRQVQIERQHKVRYLPQHEAEDGAEPWLGDDGYGIEDDVDRWDATTAFDDAYPAEVADAGHIHRAYVSAN